MNNKWTPFRKLIRFERDDFFKFVKNPLSQSEICKAINSGDIVIIEKVVSTTDIDHIISEVTGYDFETIGSPKIIEGVKNLKYKSEGFLNKGDGANQYLAIDNSYYFFPWNQDDLKIFSRFQEIYDAIIKINGYEPEVIHKNTPKDRVVERFHLIHYPLNSGEISLHLDPINIIKVNAGIYFSEFGVDYSDGGFYVIDSSKSEINLDKEVRKGDLILFSPNLAHGVKRITLNTASNDLSTGRYFFHMSLVESHEFKDREKSVGLEVESL